jgi:hypothetical protein
MNRRSWQIELPHIGDLPAGTHSLRNSSTCACATASVIRERCTCSVNPERPCVAVFQASMPDMTSSGW